VDQVSTAAVLAIRLRAAPGMGSRVTTPTNIRLEMAGAGKSLIQIMAIIKNC